MRTGNGSRVIVSAATAARAHAAARGRVAKFPRKAVRASHAGNDAADRLHDGLVGRRVAAAPWRYWEGGEL